MSDVIQDASRLSLKCSASKGCSTRTALVVGPRLCVGFMNCAHWTVPTATVRRLVRTMLAVDMALKQKRGGVFLDVGGYDGVTGSNTFFLEVFRGWTNALVEPVPAQLQKAKEVRRCPCLGVAVAANEGKADFIEVSEGYTQMSGLAEAMTRSS